MIDYIALSIGHALLGLAFWHLFLRDSIDADPLIERLEQEARDKRKAAIAQRKNPHRGADETPA